MQREWATRANCLSQHKHGLHSLHCRQHTAQPTRGDSLAQLPAQRKPIVYSAEYRPSIWTSKPTSLPTYLERSQSATASVTFLFSTVHATLPGLPVVWNLLGAAAGQLGRPCPARELRSAPQRDAPGRRGVRRDQHLRPAHVDRDAAGAGRVAGDGPHRDEAVRPQRRQTEGRVAVDRARPGRGVVRAVACATAGRFGGSQQCKAAARSHRPCSRSWSRSAA